MKIKRNFLLFLTVLFLIYGCALDTSGYGPADEIWLDGPLHLTGVVGQPIALTFHANFFPDFRYTMYFNTVHGSLVSIGEVVFMEYTPELYEAIGEWVPTEPGQYNLRGCDERGRFCSNPRYIEIVSAMIYEPAEEDGEPIPTTSSFEPVPVGEITFSADLLNLAKGNCTYLRWTSSFIDDVYLDGEAVALSGIREICPEVTTTYTIEGIWSGGSQEKTVVINVIESTLTTTVTEKIPNVIKPSDTPLVFVPSTTPTPVDTTGPSLSNITQSATSIYDGTACGVTSNTIQIKAADPSGITKVQVSYRAIRSTPPENGSWQMINMTSIGGGVYEARLGIPELQASLNLYTPGIVEFYIRAWDGKNNITQSSTYTFTSLICFT